jgi:hypothetical protein
MKNLDRSHSSAGWLAGTNLEFVQMSKRALIIPLDFQGTFSRSKIRARTGFQKNMVHRTQPERLCDRLQSERE